MNHAALASMIAPLVWREQGDRMTFAEPEVGVIYQVVEFGQWTKRPFQLTVIDGNHSKQAVTFHEDRSDAVKVANEDYVRRILSGFPRSPDANGGEAHTTDEQRVPAA